MLHVDRTFDVLITDDNASFRRVLREVLEDRPFLRLHEAESSSWKPSCCSWPGCIRQPNRLPQLSAERK